MFVFGITEPSCKIPGFYVEKEKPNVGQITEYLGVIQKQKIERKEVCYFPDIFNSVMCSVQIGHGGALLR